MASAERLSTASSHSTPAATRFTLSTGEYSSCTHTHIGACTAASLQEGPGFDSRMGRCWYWGAGSPQAFSAQVGYLPGLSVWRLHVLPRPSVLRWAISRAFLCGVCMFSPDLQCSGGLSPGPFCVEIACSPHTSSAQVGYLPGFSVWSLHVLPVFPRGFLH